jgi:MFS family permease
LRGLSQPVNKVVTPTRFAHENDRSMNEEPSAPVAQGSGNGSDQHGGKSSDIDYRLLIPFLTHVTITQTLILIIRITTSYRAIELGLTVLWLGIIATGFAIIPAFTALQVGRWIDRGNDARAIWLGSALVCVACVGFWAWPQSAVHLVAYSVLLGFGHMFCMAGHQMLAVRSGSGGSRESVLGYYMVAASIGQGFGPFVVGWLGGSAAVPPTGYLFTICLFTASISMIVAVLVRPSRKVTRARDANDFVPIGQLLKLRGFTAVMASSVVTVTALDLLVIYLPALGAERQIDASNIGLLLTVRSAAALISRLFYARAIYTIGRSSLTLASMLGSAASFLLLALPLTLPAMYAVLALLGLAIGIASTLTISGVVHLAPAEATGTALTLRMTGNRVGQIVFPALAGLVAAATGVAGILLALGFGLAASGIAVAMSEPPPPTS